MKGVVAFAVSAALSGALNYMLLFNRIGITDALAREGIEKIYRQLMSIPTLQISADKFRNGAVRYYESSNSSHMDNALLLQWSEDVCYGIRQ